MESQEVLKLIREAKKGNEEAIETLIERYLNTVRKINNKWGGTDDGFQEGILGIYEAIKTYDFSYNTKFLTHLYPNIEARIRRFIDKGVDIKRYSNRDIKNIEEYMNNYPRKMFGGLSSNEVYDILYNSH